MDKKYYIKDESVEYGPFDSMVDALKFIKDGNVLVGDWWVYKEHSLNNQKTPLTYGAVTQVISDQIEKWKSLEDAWLLKMEKLQRKKPLNEGS